MKIWCTKCDWNMENKGIVLDCPINGNFYICSKCGYRIVVFDDNYCPHGTIGGKEHCMKCNPELMKKTKNLRFQLTIKLNDNDYNKLYDGKLFKIAGIFRYPSKATRITFSEVK